ncbi:MAG: flagellar filament capping protein FliD [Actinomycetota bacterium]|nr:flagellar filament capping protein FliD [Actinomycetota bacterium]
MAASIDGLGSGLDTSSIISSLISIEKQSQTRLSTQRQAVLARGTAWTGVETQLTALKSAIDKLKAGGLSATTATSSTPSVAIVTGSPQVAGVHGLTVTALASAQRLTSPKTSSTTAGAGQLAFHDGKATIGASSMAATGLPNGTYKVEVMSVSGNEAKVRVGAGEPVTVTLANGSATNATLSVPLPGGGTGTITLSGALRVGTASLTTVSTGADTKLADVAAKVNAAAGGLSAVVVSDGASTPNYRLVFTGTKTGSDSNVTLTSTYTGVLAQQSLTDPVDTSADSKDPLAGSVSAANASFTFDGIPVSRPTNTVTDLVPGATITLVDAGGQSTVTVTPDPAAGLAAGKALVDSLNSVLKQIATGVKYDQAAKKAGPLTGDGGARGLARELTGALSTAARGASGITLGGATTTTSGTAYTTTNLGISMQRDGTYAFDSTAFAAALRDKPVETKAFVDAIAGELEKVVTQATSSTGVVGASKKGAADRAAQLQKQVDAWDDRLEAIENRLRRQYSALDTAMSSLRSQSTWLSGQIAGLS